MRRNKSWIALVLACCATRALAEEPTVPPAQKDSAEPAKAAQPPVQTGPAGSGVTLDTVEVTAMRRKDKLQNVPVAVTAMSEDQIQARGLERLDQLNSLAPGLQISRSPSNSTISQIAIRGSSQYNPAIYWDPAVGIYVDGVYFGKAQGSIFDLVDLANVEVLRGPQGTLYGRNTIAGTINLVTREPSGRFSGHGDVEYGNYNARVGKLSVDLPRLFNLADLTVAGRLERRDGWIKTVPGASVPEFNNRRSDGARVALNLLLHENLEARYRFDWTNIDQTNVFDQLYRSDDPTLQSYVHRDRQSSGVNVNAPSLERSRTGGHSLTLSWYLSGNHTLKSITGYRKVKWIDYLDLDGSPEWVAHTKRLTDYKQLSEDLHALGRFGALYYTAGFFYFQDDGFTNNPQTFESGALNFDSEYGTQTHAWAGYGQLDWKLIEPLTLSAGVRYTRERKGLDRILGFSPVPGSIPDGCRTEPACAPPGTGMVYYIPVGFHVEETFGATTPMFSVAWRATKTLNFYVRYAEGFKSGGFNGEYSNLQDTPAALTPPGTQNTSEAETSRPFRPERQKSLELGAKTSFFGGRALLNLAAFRNKLVDLQISSFTGQGAAASIISNAGKATVLGAEIEAAIMPFAGTTLRANYAYLHPSYDEFIDRGPPNDAAGQPTVQNEADNRAFVHAPKHSFNVVLDSVLFHTPLGALRGVVDYVWTDSFYTYPYQLVGPGDPRYDSMKQEAKNTRVPAIGLLNARLALTTIPLGRAVLGELALWGRNLTDNASPNNFIDFGPGAFQNLTVANFVEPRTYGLSAIVRW